MASPPTVAMALEALDHLHAWLAPNAANLAAYATLRAFIESSGADAERLQLVDKAVAAMVEWLEANQPDVWKRGLWDAITSVDAARSLPPQQKG